MQTRFMLVIALALGASCKSAKSEGFPTPEAAMKELADTIGTHDDARLERLFGKDGPDMLRSGDDVADRDDALRVQKYIHEKLAFEERGPDTRIALLGEDGWPFPIPLVREDGGWRFDVEAGVEELANRRVGRNEISTLASLHAYVDAQREYASEERDGQPKAFAKQIFSTRGKHDGLYWPTVDGEPDSPLGPLMAEAASAGYTNSDEGPEPFHGYYYRVLLLQGSNAPGGAKHFADEKGRMTRGFAMIAWPAKYGTSGVMTFLVGPQGIVFQKDLGEKTEEVAGKITAFDPDDSWDPTGD
jgi:Protein of unknown function (DUF2950)